MLLPLLQNNLLTGGAVAHDGAATFAGAGSLSAIATLRLAAAATFQGAGNLSALAINYKLAEATFQGTGSLSALAFDYKLGAATFQGVGSLSALAVTYKLAEATFQGAGALSAYANLRMLAFATLNGVGDLSADATQIAAGGEAHQGEARFNGAGALSADTLQFIFIQPDADSIDGGWTNEADGTTLAPSIDEMVADDADYIKSSAIPNSDTCKIGLSNPLAAPAQPFIVMYRYRKSGADQVDLNVRLLEGVTEIAAWSHTNIAGTFVNGEQALTGGQFAAIGDFDNLFIEFTADAP